MTPRIHYNIVADFLYSIMRMLEGEEYKKFYMIKRFKENQDIIDYFDHIEKNINPILKRDIEYSCGKFYKGLFVLIIYALEEGIDDITSLLDNIDNMSGKGFINLINEELDLNIPKDANREQVEKIFEEEIANEIVNHDNVQIYMDYFEYSDDMKERLVKTLRAYYLKFFKDIEEDVKSFMRKKLEEHRRLLEKDSDKFFENIVLMMDKEQIMKGEVTFYINYFTEVGCGLWSVDNKYNIYYGYSLEQRFDEEMTRIEYKELIKILSDDNRFNIIKVLGKRAWYSKELADHCGITTATMSYHIKKISSLGLINVDSGKNKRLYYKLNKDRFVKIVNNMLEDVVGDK